MSRVRTQSIRNERGIALALMAVSVAALLGVLALAIDLSMLFKTRNEAQRAADASALAGASAFLNQTGILAVPAAQALALEYAQRNTMTGGPIQPGEVTIQVIPDSEKVRVWVNRAEVGTWFARIFGINFMPVGAKAAAEATLAGAGKCVKPFAVPDLWFETSVGPPPSPGQPGQDVNANRIWDSGEGWEFEPVNSDLYARYDPSDVGGLATQTGYGSAWRNGFAPPSVNDYGLSITVKAQRPGEAIASGFFYPWRIGESSGAKDYKNNIFGCNPAPVELGVPYDIENGNMVGPTRQGVDSLIGLDPDAYWDPLYVNGDGRIGAVQGTSYGDWRNSPRVIPVGLFDPNQLAGIQGAGSLQVTFNDIALLFLEGLVGNGVQAPLKARFLYFATGSGPEGPTVGPLIKLLRLVE